MSFKFLEHTADLKIEVTEKTLNRAFSTSAWAMKEVMAEQILVAPRIKKEFVVEGDDKSALLYNFLEEFLYLFDTEGFILSKAPIVKITEKADSKDKKFSLEAKVIGDSASNYIITNDVKAITYNEMSIDEDKDNCIIVFVLDV